MSDAEKKLEYLIMQNKIILDTLNSLVKSYAKLNNLAIEECSEECEYISAT